jgi:hypothetical protein
VNGFSDATNEAASRRSAPHPPGAPVMKGSPALTGTTGTVEVRATPPCGSSTSLDATGAEITVGRAHDPRVGHLLQGARTP